MSLRTRLAITAVLLVCASGGLQAQVAPAAKGGGFPIGISIGVSRFNLDYGPGRYMEGPVVDLKATVFHGLGVDVDARSIFMNTPLSLERMQQSTFLAGVYYQARPYWRFRPFVRFGGGLGLIEFPSRNPYYTRDTYTVYAPSGGFEYPIVNKVYLRAEYEYQYWKDFQSLHYLNPQGFTVGVTYYLRGHRRSRE